MKIIIASDLHGNWEALQTLPPNADYYIISGDLVDYGPDSAACLDLVRKNNWPAVRGNHDQAVGYQTDCGCSYLMKEYSIASREQVLKTLDENQLEFLRNLPLERYLEISGCRFFVTHALPGDLYRYLSADVKDDILAEIVRPVAADVIIWGHTHIPYIRRIGRKTIINPGSAGQPRDGIPQASWAELSDGNIKLCRSPYPCQTTIEKIERLPLAPHIRQGLARVLATGRTPKQEGQCC
ncbi:MAG: YfcE family phosphodiesterase [Candidatus Schekmanbacteria bacterium]|nr:YfcE family phosphodiesterase [Candidatus Schekmanbacteria bacterium]